MWGGGGQRLSSLSPPFLSLHPSFIFNVWTQPSSSSSLGIQKAGSPTKQGARGKETLSKLPGSISSSSCRDCVAWGCGKLDLGLSLSAPVHGIRQWTQLRVHCVALAAERLARVRVRVCLFLIVGSAAIACFPPSALSRCFQADKILKYIDSRILMIPVANSLILNCRVICLFLLAG